MEIEIITNYLVLTEGMNMIQELEINSANGIARNLGEDFKNSKKLKESDEAKKVIYTLTARREGTPKIEVQYFS